MANQDEFNNIQPFWGGMTPINNVVVTGMKLLCDINKAALAAAEIDAIIDDKKFINTTNIFSIFNDHFGRDQTPNVVENWLNESSVKSSGIYLLHLNDNSKFLLEYDYTPQIYVDDEQIFIYIEGKEEKVVKISKK